MRNRLVFLTCIHSFLLLATIFAFFSMFHVSYANVINVPEPYPTIQEAIDKASAGDTINVSRRSGESQSVYYEKLRVNKQLILVGESRETIIIDGGGKGTVIRIQADNVEIRGFTIRNGGQKYSGIRADSYSYVTIANNTVETNKIGVVLVGSHYNTVVQNQLFNNSAAGISLSDSIGNNISDNDVSESAYGIKLSSTNATFVNGNTVADNSYGIYLEASSNDTVDKNTLLRNGVDGVFPHACYDIIVSNNEISESAYGIQLYNSDTITVLGNNLTDNSYGIYLAYSGPSNTIENNTISRNDWGVTLYDSSSNAFTGNTLSYNTYGVDPVTESRNNLFHHNNFVENVEQVVWNPDCLNTWDDGAQGNYWSDYTGTDSNGDGIGDTAYIIDPMNKDRYPLMNPWGILRDVAILSVVPSAENAYPGQIVNITVIAMNEGGWKESFDVTVKYDDIVIETQIVSDLNPNVNVTLTFSWNTTGVALGTYVISAEASVAFGETDIADNVFVDGTVTVSTGVRDVAVKSVSLSRTLAHQGYTMLEIFVVVENEGEFDETFDVAVYYNSSEIGTKVVTLSPGGNTTLIFSWDTWGVPYGNYTMSAEADVLPGEIDVADNSLVDDMVTVTIPGDINGDGVVDILDGGLISTHWFPGPPLGPLGYNANADINMDGNVDLFDAAIVSANWLKSWGT